MDIVMVLISAVGIFVLVLAGMAVRLIYKDAMIERHFRPTKKREKSRAR